MKNFSIFGSRVFFFLLTPWLLLGVLVFTGIAYGQFEEKRLGGALGSVVLAICCVCGLLIGISPRRFGWTVIIVTASVAAGYIWYFCDTYFVQGQALTRSTRRSDATPWNAMLGFVFIGLPCLIFTVRGIFWWIDARRKESDLTRLLPAPVDERSLGGVTTSHATYVKSLTSLGMWTVASGETSRRFDRKDEILTYLSELVLKQTLGRVEVDEDLGSRSWVSQFVFGLHPRILQMHFAFEWSGGVASLIFFDDADSEYRARDREQPVHADDATRKAIAHGELSPHPAEQCLALDRTLQAIDEYLKSGARPAWLDYDYVA